MENEVQQAIPQVKPQPQNQTLPPTPPSTNWSKILLFTFLGFVVIAGSVLVGIQMGKSQTSRLQSIVAEPTAIPTQTVSPTLLCSKEENCCMTNDDCKYIWFTGACNTPEYVTKTQKEAEAQGIHNGEAPPRENVSCTCESNKCVTHN